MTMKNIVIFGITGDLAKKKIVPALSKLATRSVAGSENYITKYIGFGRKDMSVSDFQAHIGDLTRSSSEVVANGTMLGSQVDPASERIEYFTRKWTYVQSEIDDIEGYKRLKTELGDIDSLIYVSLPPQLTENVLAGLSQSGVLGKADSRNKLLIEKPFGCDLESAKKMRAILEADFNTENIYLVDHYACKQAIVDLERLGFDGFFGLSDEKVSLNDIESIQVSILEKKGVDGRGAFYDSVGAIKDVGQNHCLRVLTSVLSALGESGTRSDILHSISFDNVKKVQDSRYKLVEGVDGESNTETYFEISGKYKGDVGVIIEGGKYQLEDKNEVAVVMKDGRILVIPINSYKGSDATRNDTDVPDAYENVIKFALEGRREYFVEFDEVLEQWRLVS